MRKPLAAVALCLALSACGGTADDASAPRRQGPPPVDAARVTDNFGWVLTPDALLTTGDGGTTFETVDLPLPASPVRAAHFTDARTGTVAAAEDTGIYVAHTTDGGKSWRTSELRDEKGSPAGWSALRLSATAGKTALLARTATSPAFNVGTLWTTTDGAAWTARSAPEAGRVSVEPGGRIWVAGTALHATTDDGRSWTEAAVAVDGGTATFAPPVDGTLPVTVTDGTHTEVQLLTTTDGGRTWGNPTRVPVKARTGPGVALPVVRTARGPVVLDSAGGQAPGLPEGVRAATFAADGRQGWALTARGSCKADKRDCTVTHDLVRTADGGATWSPVAVWSEAA